MFHMFTMDGWIILKMTASSARCFYTHLPLTNLPVPQQLSRLSISGDSQEDQHGTFTQKMRNTIGIFQNIF